MPNHPNDFGYWYHFFMTAINRNLYGDFIEYECAIDFTGHVYTPVKAISDCTHTGDGTIDWNFDHTNHEGLTNLGEGYYRHVEPNGGSMAAQGALYYNADDIGYTQAGALVGTIARHIPYELNFHQHLHLKIESSGDIRIRGPVEARQKVLPPGANAMIFPTPHPWFVDPKSVIQMTTGTLIRDVPFPRVKDVLDDLGWGLLSWWIDDNKWYVDQWSRDYWDGFTWQKGWKEYAESDCTMNWAIGITPCVGELVKWWIQEGKGKVDTSPYWPLMGEPHGGGCFEVADAWAVWYIVDGAIPPFVAPSANVMGPSQTMNLLGTGLIPGSETNLADDCEVADLPEDPYPVATIGS